MRRTRCASTSNWPRCCRGCATSWTARWRSSPAAAITGADRLFPGLALPIAGQHGCERRDAAGAIHLHAPVRKTQARLRALLKRLAKRHPQLQLEDKGAALALHYRSSPQLASHVHRTLRRSLAPDEGYALQPGKMLLEVRPEGRDKGTAIDDFMAEAPFAGRVPVFVGDDLTDEHGFAAVERLGGWTVKVGPGRTAARFRLADPAAVRQWLGAPTTLRDRRRRAQGVAVTAQRGAPPSLAPCRRRNAQPRPRADRQRPHRRARRRRRVDRVGVLPALRRRSGVLRAARSRRAGRRARHLVARRSSTASRRRRPTSTTRRSSSRG